MTQSRQPSWSLEMPPFLSRPRELLRFALFGVFGVFCWLYVWAVLLGNALAGPISAALLCFYLLLWLGVSSQLIPQLGRSRVVGFALILLNGAATVSALTYLCQASVRDYEAAAGLWGLLIGLVLLRHATQTSPDDDPSRFGSVIHISAKFEYWLVCFLGFLLTFNLYAPSQGDALPWSVAAAILTIGLWTLPYPRRLTLLIERFR